MNKMTDLIFFEVLLWQEVFSKGGGEFQDKFTEKVGNFSQQRYWGLKCTKC